MRIFFDRQHFKVYDPNGGLLCDATVNHQGIVDGKAKEFNEGEYLEFEGNFRNGKKCGEGTEYFSMSGQISKIGKWEDDKLINGTVFDVVLDEKKVILKKDSDLFIQLHGYDGNSLFGYTDYSYEYMLAVIEIQDKQVIAVRDIRVLADFVEAE